MTVGIFLSILLTVLCLPNVLAGWAFAALVRALWGKSLTWHGLVLVAVLKEGSWPRRTWWKPRPDGTSWVGFSLGHGIMLAPVVDQFVLPHELEHTEQVQAGSVTGLVVGLLLSALGWWWLGLIVWTLLPALNYLGGALVALLKRKHGYTDNTYERAARAAAVNTGA